MYFSVEICHIIWAVVYFQVEMGHIFWAVVHFQIVFQSAQTEDAGVYECKAINAAGVDRVSITVEVYSK